MRGVAAAFDRGVRLPEIARRVPAGRRLGAGKRLSEPADIARISAEVANNSMDLLQAPHTFSGIEIALWDVLGRRAASRCGECSAIA